MSDAVTARRVTLLKSDNHSELHGPDGELGRYRVDLLGRHGYDLAWTDRHIIGVLGDRLPGRLLRRTEALVTPWMQTLATWRLRRRSDVVLAFFESEGHGLALWRHLPGIRRRPPLVIVSCWLSELATRAPEAGRRRYRWLYRTVDEVVVLSSNQVETLRDVVGIPADRISVARFGVDVDALGRLPTADDGTVVAAGRDLGRDWPTLLAAADGTGWRVDLITRPAQVDGLALPDEVRLVGEIERDAYLARLASAAVVVVPTVPRDYPTGQSVLLEAMALGKACVVTRTPSLAEYLDTDAVVTVPPDDPAALRAAVDRLLADDAARAALGVAARAASVAQGGADTMWAQIAAVLDRAVERAGRD